MYLSVEKGMRGVIFDNTKRFNKANNKYMISYDNSKPRKYITYMDAINLYDWAMSQYPPYSKFKW